MRIIDKYILGSVVGVFLLCLSTFMLLYVVADALSHLEDILKNHVPLAVLAEYYFSYLPLIFSRVSAFACLLATIYTFGKFTKDNEMIALRASGLDIYQITRPVLIFAGPAHKFRDGPGLDDQEPGGEAADREFSGQER
jgi:lipopolysaccharide export LptBFGC system permease protein LptF